MVLILDVQIFYILRQSCCISSEKFHVTENKYSFWGASFNYFRSRYQFLRTGE